MGTGLCFFHSRTMASLNSIGVRKWRDILQATRGLRYSHSFLPTESRPIYVPPPLLERFYLALVSARLSMVLVLFWRCLSSPGVMSLALRILRFWKHQSSNTWWKISSPYPSSMIIPDTMNLSRSTIALGVQESLKDLVFPYEGWHVLSVFLFNTNLHATQK